MSKNSKLYPFFLLKCCSERNLNCMTSHLLRSKYMSDEANSNDHIFMFFLLNITALHELHDSLQSRLTIPQSTHKQCPLSLDHLPRIFPIPSRCSLPSVARQQPHSLSGEYTSTSNRESLDSTRSLAGQSGLKIMRKRESQTHNHVFSSSSFHFCSVDVRNANLAPEVRARESVAIRETAREVRRLAREHAKWRESVLHWRVPDRISTEG